jgi:Ca-activated chloride channel family protein
MPSKPGKIASNTGKITSQQCDIPNVIEQSDVQSDVQPAISPDAQMMDSDDSPVSLDVAMERPLCEVGGDRRYVLATLRAADLNHAKPRPPLAVAFALDRSGSMRGPKLRLTCEAVRVALRHLQPTDAFALVVFDGEVDVLTELCLATPAALEQAGRTLDQVEARGNTALYAGWHQAATLLQRGAAALVPTDAVRRVVLLTDGEANAGPSSPAELRAAAAQMAQTGVVTTTLGVGHGFAEELLAGMAAAGHGQFHFARAADDLPRIMGLEVGEAASVVARQVVLRCVAAPGVRVRCVSAFAVQTDANRLDIAVGDLRARQELMVLVEANVAEPGAASRLEFSLLDRDGELPLPVVGVQWQRGSAEAVRNQPLDAALAGRVADRLAAEGLVAMTEDNRRHDFRAVTRRWEQLRTTLTELGAHLPAVAQVLREASDKAAKLAREMDEMERKGSYHAAMMRSKSRSPDGSSREY